MDGELEALLENGEGLSDKNQVLSLSRLMVRIETLEQKLTCLKLIQVRRTQLKGRDPRPVKAMPLELLLSGRGRKVGERSCTCASIPSMSQVVLLTLYITCYLHPLLVLYSVVLLLGGDAKCPFLEANTFLVHKGLESK